MTKLRPPGLEPRTPSDVVRAEGPSAGRPSVSTAPVESRVARGIASAESLAAVAPGLASGELATFTFKKEWTDNAKVQFAWDLRDALTKRLDAKPAPQRSPVEQYLAKQLAAIASGEIDPRVASEVLTSLARGLSPGQQFIGIDGSAEKILGRTLPQLKLALAELRHAKTTKTGKVDAPKLPRSKTGELGRAIVGALLADVAANARSPGADLMSQVGWAPAFVWGQLAEAAGAKSADAFFAELAGATPEQLADCAAWLRDKGRLFSTMQGAASFAPASVQSPLTQSPLASAQSPLASARSVADVLADVRALAIDPGASPILRAQGERLARGLDEALGIRPDDLALQVRARQRDACHAVAAAFAKVEQALGPERAAQVLGRIDVEAEIANVADLRDGIRIYTDLDDPSSLRRKADALTTRLASEALRTSTDDLRTAIARDAGLADVSKIFDVPGDGAVVRAALAAITAWAEPAKPGESASAHALRLASALSAGPDLATRVTTLLHTELTRDRDGLLGDLREQVEGLTHAAAGVAEDRAHRDHLDGQLSRGVLPLGRDALDAMKGHLAECYPNEGMGYLATDGRATYFFPVTNLLAPLGLGRSRGEDDPQDVERLANAAERLGLQLLAKVHSHPDESPVFSDADLIGMRASVAIAPELRTVIVEVSKRAHGFDHRVASFSSLVDGQVRSEDRLAVA